MNHRAKGLQSLATLIARATGNVVAGPEYAARLEGEGLTHAQAAERLGVSESTSKRYAKHGAPREVVDRL